MTAANYILKAIHKKAKEGHKLSNKDVQQLIIKIGDMAKDKKSIAALKLSFSKISYIKPKNLCVLTNREKEILHIIGNGKDSNSIAKQLNLKVSTIETHRKNIRKKLQIKGKGKLFQIAYINNLLTINDDN